jgi:transcriptional regulator with XRE-family HTH domain
MYYIMNYATEDLLQTLKEARVRKGLSQRELARLAGIQQSHISKIETGEVDPRISTLMELGRALGLELILVSRKALPAVRAVAESVDPTRTKTENDRGLAPKGVGTSESKRSAAPGAGARRAEAVRRAPLTNRNTGQPTLNPEIATCVVSPLYKNGQTTHVVAPGVECSPTGAIHG